MNSKGSFSAIVGASFVLLLASIAVAFYTSSQSQSAFIEQQDSLELRQQWTNARFALDKAAALAIYQNLDNKCKFTGSQSTLEAGFLRALGAMRNGGECSFGQSLSFSGSSKGPFNISLTLSCSKGSGFISRSVSYKKDVSGNDPSDCAVNDISKSSDKFQEIPLPAPAP